MSRIHFTQETETWWFDPETGEYHYEGPSAMVRVLLANMTEYTETNTQLFTDVTEHPGEESVPLSPEERRRKVVNYLTRLEGVKVHERETASN